MWLEVMPLSKEEPASSTLIGAHMVATYGWMRARVLIRPSKDVDILVNVRVVSQGTSWFENPALRC
jgi:hypothetical protein